MDDTLLRLRQEEFPITERCVYLNHAASAPLPRRTVARLTALAEAASQQGDRTWFDRVVEMERVRGLAARLLGAKQTCEVAFVENTSTGLSWVAEGFPWRPGDNVVGAELEFSSNVYPWMRLADYEVEYRLVPERDGRIDPDELLGLVDDNTRMVALSWVQYASGFRSDLGRIGRACRERGVLFVVDVIQGLGALTLDVERDCVDVAVASAHKWLLGPEGTGLFYISQRVIDHFRPLRAGWRSTRIPFQWKDYDLTWNEGAKRFESGSMNSYGLGALGASLEVLLEAGPEAVERQVLALADRTARGLEERGFHVVSSRRPGETSAIVAATHPDLEPRDLVKRLGQQDIVVAARADRFRVSPHFYNTEGEIDRMLAAL